MKRLLSFFIVCLLSTVYALAYDWTDENGVTWTWSTYSYTDDNGKSATGASLTGMSGNTADVIIPDYVYNGTTAYPVVYLGANSNLFWRRTDITSVKFPSTLRSMYDSSNYTTINGTTYYYGVFAHCSNLKTVDFNDYRFKIGCRAFYSCSSLASVSLPAATSIGSSAFSFCSSLAAVELPAATSIGGSAFSFCSSLAAVELPAATSIGGSAFYSCSSLAAVELPAATSIDGDAFYNCSSLAAVSLPAATSIGSQAFRSCSSLAAVELPAATSVGDHAFYYCSSLAAVELPAATSIGGYAFNRCSKISSLRIGSVEQWCNVNFEDYYANPLYDTSPTVNLYIGDSETPATDIDVPNSVTSIPNFAFRRTTITSVTAPAATSIGSQAFQSCSSLAAVELPAATSIGGYAFSGCSALASVELPAATSIGSSAFYSCSSLASVELPAATSISGSAFNNCTNLTEIFFVNSSPATASSCFDSHTSLVVPDDVYDDYVTAWPSYVNQITIAGQREREVTVVAKDTESAIHKAIGEENLRHVLSLKVKGSINGYDIMVLRNKMINLHHLDLSEATIEGNDYEYYTGYHTTDNEIGSYAFYNLPNLFSVKLPDVTAIKTNAFAYCKSLREINLPESLTTLSNCAFNNCYQLSSIEIPGSVSSIGSNAFYDCYRLENVTFHEGLKTIGDYAFSGCGISQLIFPESLETIKSYAFAGGHYFDGQYRYNNFRELNLPPNLNTIDSYAFSYCTNLQVVRLNPMLKNISNYAFSSCNALKKVYSYTLEPTDILQDTYSAYKTADLYVPTPSYYTYYYNTQWSQFLSVNKSDEEYDFKSFYITKDYEMDDNTGILGGDPDAELGENSGLINSGSETQDLGTVTMRFNGNNGSASIIANGNLTAEKIKVEITVTGNKWHFFCFPFDVPLSGVSVSGNKAYVFRHYNAAKRATGASGWEDLPADQDHLIAGEGYIFQANGNTTLTVVVDNKTTFVGENVAAALHVQDAANVANASWNFTGNPGYAYFDIDDLGFSAPITVWDPNTNNYVALRPGDDDLFLHPFQAFFVQKPEGTDALTFNAEDRTTYLESQKAMTRKADSRRRALANVANNPRKLVNISVTDGTNTDNTRVVFNDEKSMAYEMDCDAAKFAATGVPQLYSIGNDDTHYAINERPNGDGTVRLGFTADKAGNFSIEAGRMDTPCYLKDLETGYTHDFNDGAYEFTCAQGTFENRFLLVNVLIVEGIETIELDSIAADAVIYDLQGRRVERAARGIFVVNGTKVNVK